MSETNHVQPEPASDAGESPGEPTPTPEGADRTGALVEGTEREPTEATEREAADEGEDSLPPEPGEAPSPRPARKRKGAPRGKRSVIDRYRDLVGVMTDAEVAAKAGVTSSAVAQYRNRRGIAAALPQGSTRRAQRIREAATPGGADARAADAPPPVRRNGGQYGWRVRLMLGPSAVDRVVLASDAASACRLAARYGEVLTVERLSPAI
ncbi:MAG: hypothetical protein R3F59_22135 [Myxococcota bacterium]